MTLKLIPTESATGNVRRGKFFNPGRKMKKQNGNKSGPLKNICFRLVHFINKGSHFTYQQVDDLIVSMHQSILSLQKKKQEILKNKNKK